MQNCRSANGHKVNIRRNHGLAFLRRAYFARHRQHHLPALQLRKIIQQALLLIRLLSRKLEAVPQRDVQEIHQISIDQ